MAEAKLKRGMHDWRMASMVVDALAQISDLSESGMLEIDALSQLR